MTINVVGTGDNRPVIYTLLKVCQTLGDVLLVSNRDYIFRLSSTAESGGHYQNVMVGYAEAGIDDFYSTFSHDKEDFFYVITENAVDADADLTVFIKSMSKDANEAVLEFLDTYATIEQFNALTCKDPVFARIEEFEGLRDMCSMPQPIVEEVANVAAKSLDLSVKNFISIAMKNPTKAPPATFHDYMKKIRRMLHK